MVQDYWTSQECERVFKYYSIIGDDVIKDLHNRSTSITENKAERMGILKPRPFTQDEQRLIKTYGTAMGDAVCFLLPGHSPFEIHTVCSEE